MARVPGTGGCPRVLRSCRPTGFVLGWAVALAVAAGFGAVAGSSSGRSDSPPPPPPRPVPAAATADVAGLPAALLPPGAFGPGVQVTHLPAGELTRAQGMAGAATGVLSRVQLDPPQCEAALRQAVTALSSARDAAGEVARGTGTFTAELLVASSPQSDVASRLTAAASTCASAGAGTAQDGSAAVRLTPLRVPLADGAVAMAVSVTGRPGAAASAHGGLIGLVQDGDRLVLLAQGASAGEPDSAAFTGLLARAAAQSHAHH